jgi:hypothetical protein
MKRMNILLSIIILITIFSCSKPHEEPQIIVSKTKVKKGEMVTATVIHQPAGTKIIWRASNYNEMLSVSPGGKMAKVFFIKGNEEEYTLQAGFYKIGGDSLVPPFAYISKNIEIENDYFKFPDNLPGTVQPVPVDFLALCPILMTDSSLALVFYCIPNNGDFNSYLVIRDVNISNGNIKATINQIWKPDPNETLRSPAEGELFTKHVYQDGRYSIEINYGNKTYQIPFEVSNNATRYTFYESNPSFITLRSMGRDFNFSYLNGGSPPAVYTVNKF